MNREKKQGKIIEETVTWSVIGDLECNKCESLRFHRLKRSKWMRLFSKSILIQCKECNLKRFLPFGG